MTWPCVLSVAMYHMSQKKEWKKCVFPRPSACAVHATLPFSTGKIWRNKNCSISMFFCLYRSRHPLSDVQAGRSLKHSYWGIGLTGMNSVHYLPYRQNIPWCVFVLEWPPRGMIAHKAKVMPILSSVLVHIGFFLTLCVRKTLYALASLEYCNNTWGRRVRIGFSDQVWRDQPRGHPENAAGPEGCPRGWSRHMKSGKTL